MTKQSKGVRNPMFKLLLVGVAGFGIAGAAAAGGKLGADADVRAGAAARAPGEVASGAMSPSGRANTNAQWQDTAARAQDRVENREPRLDPNVDLPRVDRNAEIDARARADARVDR